MLTGTKYSLPDGFDEKQFIGELSEHYSIKQDAARSEIVAFYDTFDWRLYRKKLVLIEEGDRLLLRRLNDRQVIHSLETGEPPAFVWDLPDGDLKARLTPIVEMRALLKLVEFKTRTNSYRILNRDEKTVLWLMSKTLRLSSRRDASDLATYVWVKPVRGYPKYEERVVDRLEDLGLSAVNTDDIYLKALKVVGKMPGDYSARCQWPDLPPDFCSRRTLSMTMPRSTALHMS